MAPLEAALVGLGVPVGAEIAVDRVARRVRRLPVVALRVVVARGVAGEPDLGQAARLLHDRAAGALLGPGGEEDGARREQGEHQQREGQDAPGPSQADRGEVGGVAGERLEHGRGLTGGLAGARRLDREHLLEVVHHLADVLVAVLGLLRRGPLHDRRQRGRDLRAAALHVGKRLAHVLHRDGHLRVGLEGRLAGEHLVQDDAERVDVRLARDLVAQRLLGRHVVGRAQHASGGGEPLRLERPCDSEVRDLGAPVGVDQHVLRLHVPVHELGGVRGLERAPDLDRIRHRLGHRQPSQPPDAVLERLAVDVLEDDVGSAVVLARVDDGHDVRMVQPGDGAGLAPEALELIGVVRDVPVHQLDRHPALERGVERPVHARHPAGPDLLVEPVALADERADHGHLFSASRWLFTPATTPIPPAPRPGLPSPVCAV